MAGNHTLVRTKGDTFNLDFTVAIDEVPWDFTGWTAKFQVRTAANSPTVLLDLSTGSGITMTSSGAVSINASSADMSFSTGRFVYDFELTSPSGDVETLLAGAFILEDEVTR